MAAIPSPQFPGWLPGSEIDHVGSARQHLRSVFPDASLNPSSPEMVLIESLAVELGPIAMSYQNAPAVVVEYLMGLYGLTRHQGRRAVGKALFRVATSAAMVTIPAGTVLRHRLDEYAGTLEYQTIETIVVVTSESLEGEAWIEATETGVLHNGLPAEAPLETADYMMHVASVEVSESTRAGEGPEADQSFTERARALLARQNSALVYADQFKAAPLVREEVGRVGVVNNWNGTTAASALGHITVAVTDTTGEVLTADQRADIREWLQSDTIASVVVHVISPTYTTVNLAVTVEALSGVNHAEVQAAVVAELERRLDPMGWSWWNTVTSNDMVSWVDDVPGVGRVVTVPGNVTLSGVAPLPRPGTMTVTVNGATR